MSTRTAPLPHASSHGASSRVQLRRRARRVGMWAVEKLVKKRGHPARSARTISACMLHLNPDGVQIAFKDEPATEECMLSLLSRHAREHERVVIQRRRLPQRLKVCAVRRLQECGNALTAAHHRGPIAIRRRLLSTEGGED